MTPMPIRDVGGTPTPINNDLHATTCQLTARLVSVRERINNAALAAGRDPATVQLLAVSKTHDALQIRTAWLAGQWAFGENYLQEALDKQQLLLDLPLEWHFIGRIQTNKTRAIAENFSWVHGLSSIQQAQRLHAQRPHTLPALNVCIQVNVSAEKSKNGLAPEAVADLLARCHDLSRLRVRGLMTIPAPAACVYKKEFSPDPIQQRRPLGLLRRLRDTLATADLPLEVLSMGMSDDLEAAIAEGSTLVRIGTAIFGPRSSGSN